MRIKFNDKIYRLKEIESGVGSLMELVEEPKYKEGDFVVSEFGSILIFKEADGDRIFDHAYLPACGELIIDKVASYEGVKRHATTEEKQRMIDALVEQGKMWNRDKKCVEDIPVYKKGDILVKEYTENKKLIFILDIISEDGLMYCECYHSTLFNRTEVAYDFLVGNIWNKKLRRAVESEKKLLITELSKIGKRWNADKKCIEDIPKRKFKAGDKVRIKDGVSSKSHGGVYPYFEGFLDQYIGKVMTVKKYITTDIGEYITTSEAKRGDHHFGFAENWLEPCSDEPKVGDWVVAWDDDAPPVAGILDKIHDRCFKFRYSVGGMAWQNIIKFDGIKEHLEKVRKG